MDKIHVVAGEKEIQPLGEKESLVGTFMKYETRENKSRVLHFQYNIDGVMIEAPVGNGYKINAVEGNECYRRKYRYTFNRKAVELGEEGILGKVTRILDYGNAKYAKLDVNGQELLIEVDKDFAAEEVHFLINGENIEVWQIEIDMLIC